MYTGGDSPSVRSSPRVRVRVRVSPRFRISSPNQGQGRLYDRDRVGCMTGSYDRDRVGCMNKIALQVRIREWVRDPEGVCYDDA